MGGVLGRHAMLRRRSEVDVEYGEEEQAVDDQGNEDAVPKKMRLSRADHMIIVHVHAQLALWLYNVYCVHKLYKTSETREGRHSLHCSL